jgi:hypothetical protein
MPRRRFSFLDGMIFLACYEDLFLDCVHRVTLKLCLHLDGVSYWSRIAQGHWNLEKYSWIVEAYSKRKLGCDEDRLTAI